ncbi:hypothetical protein LTR48_006557 [Friedmanniomyces endolithicus]|uniref:Xylanolytic transcriptional activator regulatory domain-containing protein n=1 Tax=Rachicladosporium monterosium TaxID=1507873 RepID=A0ABR0KYM2_9PEZI|nr:hypothetical protein LTR48_006557 [Friedmanniomyces endolithicus]KAK5140728.1 hypothetical protein LTR32_006543 [Rachicladosporium monterosium]
MAVRIAQDLGLMLDAAPHLPYLEQEERRRVFWSVYLLDRLVSCGRGRPPAILDASCHLQLPCPEQIWEDGVWKRTLTLEELSNRTYLDPPETQGPFAHVIVMAYTLGRGAQYMLQGFNTRSRYPPWDPSSDFAAIESDLLHLETQLEMHKSIQEMLAPHIIPDGEMDHQRTGPIIFSRALYHLTYCMLNQPFLLRSRIGLGQHPAPASFLARAFDSGWQHALRLMELIRHARSAGCIAQSSFHGYCAIVAGSIAALHAHSENSDVSARAQALLQEAISYLEDVGQYLQNMSTMALILRQLSEKTFIFSEISSDRPRIATLSSADTDTMWTLIDYSTMSNEALAGVIQNQPPDANVWLDSWFELFGAVGNTKNTGTPGDIVGAISMSET